DDALRGVGGRGAVGQVHRDGVDRDARVGGADLAGHPVEAVGVAFEQDEVAAPLGERAGQLLADPAARAGDDGGAPGEPVRPHGIADRSGPSTGSHSTISLEVITPAAVNGSSAT